MPTKKRPRQGKKPKGQQARDVLTTVKRRQMQPFAQPPGRQHVAKRTVLISKTGRFVLRNDPFQAAKQPVLESKTAATAKQGTPLNAF